MYLFLPKHVKGAFLGNRVYTQLHRTARSIFGTCCIKNFRAIFVKNKTHFCVFLTKFGTGLKNLSKLFLEPIFWPKIHQNLSSGLYARVAQYIIIIVRDTTFSKKHSFEYRGPQNAWIFPMKTQNKFLFGYYTISVRLYESNEKNFKLKWSFGCIIISFNFHSNETNSFSWVGIL